MAEFAAAELGAELQMSPHAAARLIGDALDLRHRLPKLWARILRGEVKPWIGRKTADPTRHVSFEAVASIDARISPRAHSLSWGRLEAIMEAAAIKAGPESDEPGDPREPDTTVTPMDRQTTAADPRPPASLYFHLSEEAITRDHTGAARFEGVGPITVDQARRSLDHCHVTMRPVIDLEQMTPVVDSYEIPNPIREAAHLRGPSTSSPTPPTPAGDATSTTPLPTNTPTTADHPTRHDSPTSDP